MSKLGRYIGGHTLINTKSNQLPESATRDAEAQAKEMRAEKIEKGRKWNKAKKRNSNWLGKNYR